MKNNIEMIENMLNTERRNRRGNREIRFEVNSNYYEAVSKLLSDYKRVLKENETYKKQYFCLINRIENKIDKFDYEFEKAKRKNDNDRVNYYWDLIRNFKKLLESEDNNEII